MRTTRLSAIHIQMEGVLANDETALQGNLFLAFFNIRIAKLAGLPAGDQTESAKAPRLSAPSSRLRLGTATVAASRAVVALPAGDGMPTAKAPLPQASSLK